MVKIQLVHCFGGKDLYLNERGTERKGYVKCVSSAQLKFINSFLFFYILD